MPLYMLIKVEGSSITSGHKTNIGLFDTQAKALAMQTSLELELYDSGSLCGVSFYVEEWYTK